MKPGRVFQTFSRTNGLGSSGFWESRILSGSDVEAPDLGSLSVRARVSGSLEGSLKVMAWEAVSACIKIPVDKSMSRTSGQKGWYMWPCTAHCEVRKPPLCPPYRGKTALGLKPASFPPSTVQGPSHPIFVDPPRGELHHFCMCNSACALGIKHSAAAV